MKFRNKILVSIYGVVVSLLLITFFIADRWMRSRIEATFGAELQTNASTLAVLGDLQAEQLVRSCTVIAESPRLRAVIELGDAGTAEQLAAEIANTTVTDLLLLTDAQGRPLAGLLEGRKTVSPFVGLPTVEAALQGTPSTDLCALDAQPYRIVTAPFRIGSTVFGSLTLGYRIRVSDVLTLRRATGSDVVILDDARVLLSNVPEAEAKRLAAAFLDVTGVRDASDAPAAEPVRFVSGEESYVALERVFGSGHTHTRALRYLLAKPIGRALREGMQPVRDAFVFLSLLFLAVTTVLGHVIARGITRPINALVRGTAEIARGNYDIGIDVRGRNEFANLAARFVAMGSALKDTIRRLAEVNADLVGRNRDLDDALNKLREAQEEIIKNERLAASGKLAAQLAHEVNNPVHNIRSCLQTALTRLPSDVKGRDLIEVAHEEIERMSRLTRQLLDLYRTSIVREELSPVDLGAVLRDVLALVSNDLRECDIEAHLQLASDLPRVDGIADKLKQVFLNLVLNARDAMPKGGRLDIRGHCDGATIAVSVTDTGTGIPREHLPKIFDAFFTTKGKVSGVGLGLSVVYGIVSLHGGSITVESEPGAGTTFTITLPVTQRAAA